MSCRILAASSLVVLFGASPGIRAQRAATPSLQDVLKRLDANLKHYDARVPSLFCDEHVVSQVSSELGNEHAITDSVFRLQRTTNADLTTSLTESREVKKVESQPAPPGEDKAASSGNVAGPTLLSGVFEGGLGVVSLDQMECMSYRLDRIARKRPNQPYVIHFATVLTPENTAHCLLEEDSKGRAFIDPASMQVTRLEITTPHHTIVPGKWYAPRVVGKRLLTVDYAPVALGGESFWLPSMVTMRAISGAGTFHMTTWTFEAAYRNYHKVQVTSRLLPTPE